MTDTRLPRLFLDDPRNCLSEAARRRVSAAHAEADLIQTRALAAIESRYRGENGGKTFADYLTSGPAAIELAESRLKAAMTVLSVAKEEYMAAGKSDHELRQLMKDEIDAAAHSLELTTIQRDLLWRELEQKSRASIEASLASKLVVAVHLPPGLFEQHLERCAKEALPNGSEGERAEFRQYWREQAYRERERQDREREHSERSAERQFRTLARNPVETRPGFDSSGSKPENRVDAGLPDVQTTTAGTASGSTQSDVARTTAKSGSKGRKRGPRPDQETAARVAEVVSRVVPNGDWRPKVDDICEALDEKQVPFPRPWRRNRQCRSWSDCLERDIVIKAIEYRLKIAKKQQEATPKTFS